MTGRAGDPRPRPVGPSAAEPVRLRPVGPPEEGTPPAASRPLVGVLNVRKEPGWTSHDVVARLRRLSGQRRVGHAGTLDPMAEGVLPVLFGRATRLADLVGVGQKRYQAEVQLGLATTTDDAEGDVVERAPLPPLTEEAVERALARWRGEVQQVPPAYSAVKVHGQRAYAVARRGEEVALAPRTVRIDELRLLWLRADLLGLEVVCSRGTYVRALARDLARALGTVGHLRRLVRTAVGPFRLEDAATIAEIEAGGLERRLLPADAALPDAPRLHADAKVATDLARGRTVAAAGLRADPVVVYDPQGQVVCIGAADGQRLQPRILLVAEPADLRGADRARNATAGVLLQDGGAPTRVRAACPANPSVGG